MLGGARSGKSGVAERLAGRLPAPVTYLATAEVADADFAARVDDHRRRRPAAWRTLEVAGDLAGALRSVEGSALVDALGTWVAGVDGFAVDPAELCLALVERRGDTVVVSDEVGLGVVPSTEVGGRFRDALGRVNQAVGEVADQSLLVVAGLTLRLDGPP